ncbi:hypothetical protein LINGRAHAP2_LOCUS34124 [Linum grandiflorum]
MLLKPATDFLPQLKQHLPPFQNTTDRPLLLTYRLLKLKPCRHPCISTVTFAAARRRTRWVEEEDEDEGEDEEYNKEIASLELYTQTSRGEALIVHASVDDDRPVEVLIFRGFSSCLSYRTAADPTKSVIPARSVIKSVDRIMGPFDPSNVEYLEKDISWDSFKSRLPKNAL